MFKKLVLLIMTFGLLLSTGYAGENCTLSGEVTFQYEGDIYINLLTKQTIQNRLQQLPPPFGMHIKLTPGQRKAKRIPYKFEAIPKGTYLVFSFQDLNGNGKLDKNTEGWEKEPCGTYKAYSLHDNFGIGLNWDNLKFTVDDDITGIEIHM